MISCRAYPGDTRVRIKLVAWRGVPPICEAPGTFCSPLALNRRNPEEIMGFGKGFLLWIIGIPLPIILLLALFWH
jgi:hypothetical protein